MSPTRKALIAVVVIAALAAFFGYTKPGRTALHMLGIATADCSDANCE